MRVYVLGVSVWGPGLEGWEASRPVLNGLSDYVPRASSPPAPVILSATERRRTSLVVRLALNVAQAASAMAKIPPAELRNVFGTSNGDGAVVGAILEALSNGDGPIGTSCRTPRTGSMSGSPISPRGSRPSPNPLCSRRGLGIRIPWELPMRTMRAFMVITM